MAGVFITTTQRSTMRPLACQGIFVTDCFRQLHALFDQIGSAHRTLFAEPVHSTESAGRQSIDWYADASCGDAVPVPLHSLPPEARAAAKQKILSLAEDIQNKAQTLLQSTDKHHALSGEMLKLALQHPADDDIWMLGDQPIVINWGFAPGTVGAQPEDLSRLAAAALIPATAVATSATPAAAAVSPVPPVAAAPIAASGIGCLSWILPLLFLLLLLALLLSALNLMPLPSLTGCMPTIKENPALATERAKEQDLLAGLHALRAQLAERAALCLPPKEEITPPQEKFVPPVQEEKELPVEEPFLGMTPEEPLVEEPLITEPFLAMTPETPPEPKPKPQPKPEQKKPEQKKPEPKKPEQKKTAPQKNEPLNIPEDAKHNDDMSFLEGCWRCETGLFNSITKEPIIAEYCFDKNGQGRRIVREQDGSICQGAVTADFNGAGQLIMNSKNARCTNGQQYSSQDVTCTGNNTSTQCRGREKEGKNQTWDARFYRK